MHVYVDKNMVHNTLLPKLNSPYENRNYLSWRLLAMPSSFSVSNGEWLHESRLQYVVKAEIGSFTYSNRESNKQIDPKSPTFSKDDLFAGAYASFNSATRLTRRSSTSWSKATEISRGSKPKWADAVRTSEKALGFFLWIFDTPENL